MPVTRSAVGRSKVQDSDSDTEEHSQASSISLLNKQSENGQNSSNDAMAKSGELPNTIKDEIPETSATVGSSELRTSTALILLVLIFLTSAIALGAVYLSFPELEPNEAVHVKFPKTIDDAKELGTVLSKYKDRYYAQVVGGVFVTYLFLQTFAIPGSIFLSIVSGYLFPFPVALLLICFCSATGASFCYLLSYLVGRRLVKKYLPERSASWAQKVEKQKGNILGYIIFLRITPFLPNWFINIVSPVIDVQLRPFWLGTFIGVAPPSFIAIQAGTTLQQLTSTTDALSFQSVALLIFFAVLSILPALLKNRKGMQEYFSPNDDKLPQDDENESQRDSNSPTPDQTNQTNESQRVQGPPIES